jgi:hypothetical protein
MTSEFAPSPQPAQRNSVSARDIRSAVEAVVHAAHAAAASTRVARFGLDASWAAHA